jgi:hypothetical protein
MLGKSLSEQCYLVPGEKRSLLFLPQLVRGCVGIKIIRIPIKPHTSYDQRTAGRKLVNGTTGELNYFYDCKETGFAGVENERNEIAAVRNNRC